MPLEAKLNTEGKKGQDSWMDLQFGNAGRATFRCLVLTGNETFHAAKRAGGGSALKT